MFCGLGSNFDYEIVYTSSFLHTLPSPADPTVPLYVVASAVALFELYLHIIPQMQP
jgi:hypothetical protein